MPDTLVALRVGTAQWMTDAGLQQLLRFLSQHPHAIDEVIFCCFSASDLALYTALLRNRKS